jgi:hypothetical protein
MEFLDFLFSGPGLYFFFTFECLWFCGENLGMDDFLRDVRTGIFGPFAIHVIEEPFCDIIGGSGVEAPVRTEKDVDRPHSDEYTENNTSKYRIQNVWKLLLNIPAIDDACAVAVLFREIKSV